MPTPDSHSTLCPALCPLCHAAGLLQREVPSDTQRQGDGQAVSGTPARRHPQRPRLRASPLLLCCRCPAPAARHALCCAMLYQCLSPPHPAHFLRFNGQELDLFYAQYETIICLLTGRVPEHATLGRATHAPSSVAFCPLAAICARASGKVITASYQCTTQRRAAWVGRCVQARPHGRRSSCARLLAVAVHGHAPQASGALKDLARLARVQGTVVVQQLQRRGGRRRRG